MYEAEWIWFMANWHLGDNTIHQFMSFRETTQHGNINLWTYIPSQISQHFLCMKTSHWFRGFFISVHGYKKRFYTPLDICKRRGLGAESFVKVEQEEITVSAWREEITHRDVFIRHEVKDVSASIYISDFLYIHIYSLVLPFVNPAASYLHIEFSISL